MTQVTTEPAEREFDFAYYASVLSRRRWIILSILLVALTVTFLRVQMLEPVYEATSLILIEKESAIQKFREGMLVETTAEDYYMTQYRLLRSKTLLKKVVDSLELKKTKEFAAGVPALQAALSISPVHRTRLVDVTVASRDPSLAAKTANAVADTFVEQNLEGKLFISRDILDALFPNGESSGETRPEIDYNSLPAVVNSPLIHNLKSLLANLESQWGDLSRRYTAEHPERRRLKSQIETMSKRIQDETTRIVEGMRADLSGRLLGNNVRVIDRAEVPAKPARPRKGRALLIAAFLGLIGGFLVALIVDTLDQTIHTQADVDRVLKVPFLGSIPAAELPEDTAEAYKKLVSGPKSFTGEALKNIRTMLGFAAMGKDRSSMLVTSTGQGEGKTFVSISLALVFSQLGERVLLLEGDLRRPSLHKRFGLSKASGISHFLAQGQDTSDLEKIIQPSGIDNLDVIVCGHIPPNPSELLSTPKVDAAMKWLRTRYQRIIIDGTPIFPITDALLWAPHVDFGTFVVKFGETNSNLAARAREKLENAGLKVAGAIVNRVTARAQSYGDYYYYYYYYHNSDYTNPADKPARQT